MPGRVPDLLLERYRLGELSAERMADVEARLAAEPDGAERLAALDASDAAILDQYPPGWFTGEVLNKQPRPQTSKNWMGLGAVLLAGTAAAWLATLGPADLETSAQSGFDPLGEEIIYAKGDPHLQLFEQVDNGTRQVDRPVHAGELVQVRYVANGAEFGAIVSIDGRGAVTWHLPLRGRRAVPLDQQGAISLEQAYQLDDAPRFERFFFVTADAPFGLDAVDDAARQLARQDDADSDDLALPGSLSQWSTTLQKVSP